MASIKLDNKYIKQTKYIIKNNISTTKKEKKEQGGISETRLINNNSNIKTIMDILKCKLCKKILLNPYDCSKCGNTFCYYCINKLKQNNLPCPFNCKSFDITPSSVGIKKFLNPLKFECKYKKNGCQEIIPYMNIENHENNCPFNVTDCPNSQCKQKIRNNMLENHIQNECPYTLFKCKNCGLNLNRKELLLHSKLCLQIKEQLESQSPIINNISQEQSVKNNKDFNSFMNILNELNEDYFYLFENRENHNYYQNYSNKGLITLIKCLISLFQNKFGIIENKLNEINNSLKKFTLDNSNITSNNNSIILDNTNKKNEVNLDNLHGNINDNKKNKVPLIKQPSKIETKTIDLSKNKRMEYYKTYNNNKNWDTINFDKPRFKNNIFLNLYDKEKSIDFFYRKLNNDEFNNNFELRNNSVTNNYIKNNPLIIRKEGYMTKTITRNKSNISQNMSFTNFLIHKKRNIDQKIMGNILDKSLNASNSFNRSNIEKMNEFNLYNNIDEKMAKFIDNRLADNINNNVYEKKIMNTHSLNSYKEK